MRQNRDPQNSKVGKEKSDEGKNTTIKFNQKRLQNSLFSSQDYELTKKLSALMSLCWSFLLHQSDFALQTIFQTQNRSFFA